MHTAGSCSFPSSLSGLSLLLQGKFVTLQRFVVDVMQRAKNPLPIAWPLGAKTKPRETGSGSPSVFDNDDRNRRASYHNQFPSVKNSQRRVNPKFLATPKEALSHQPSALSQKSLSLLDPPRVAKTDYRTDSHNSPNEPRTIADDPAVTRSARFRWILRLSRSPSKCCSPSWRGA